MVDFQKLLIWQKSHQLTLEIYLVTKKFPKEEKYGLIGQMRRSSSGIPTNIAEGSARNTQMDFKRYLPIALSSNAELRYQIILSKDLEYISVDEFHTLIQLSEEVQRMIYAYAEKLK